MYKQQLTAFFGSQKEAAKELNVSESLVWSWPNPIPRVWALDISDRFKDQKRHGVSLDYDREIYLDEISELSLKA